MRYTRSLLPAALLSLTLLTACQERTEVSQTEEGRLVLGAAESEEVIERGVNPGARTLVLEGFNGNIELTGTDASTASLRFVKRGRGSDNEHARERLSDITIDETGDDQAYHYSMESSDPAMTSVDVVGTVPRGTPVRIQLQSGSVSLSGVQGPIEVDNESGTVDISGAQRSVDVETRSGTIQADLERLPEDAAVRLVTENGNVTLALPTSISAQIEAETGAGQINVEGLRFSSRRLSPKGAGAQFAGQLGRGTARIEARTQNGTILLREGVIAAPPAADTLRMSPDTLLTPPAPIPDVIDTPSTPADTLPSGVL